MSSGERRAAVIERMIKSQMKFFDIFMKILQKSNIIKNTN